MQDERLELVEQFAAQERAQALLSPKRPTRVWVIDFKGWFRTQDGVRCDPLTISDTHTRYLLRCQAMDRTGGRFVRPLMEAAFREYGLPQRIRSDNGSPFASTGVGGLSRLSVWWLRLGITPERIEPGHPEQNGRHERMHRTLKQETAQPPSRTAGAQQQAFARFRRTLAGSVVGQVWSPCGLPPAPNNTQRTGELKLPFPRHQPRNCYPCPRTFRCLAY